MEPIDWGVTEIISWVNLAHLATVQPKFIETIWTNDAGLVCNRIERDINLIKQRQRENGGWGPIRQKENPKYARTYSTLMSVWALIESKKSSCPQIQDSNNEAIRGGIRWLLTQYDKEAESWVPNPERAKQNDAFPGLTAHVLYILERAKPEYEFLLKNESAYEAIRQAFINSIETSSPGTIALTSRDARNNERTHDSDRYLPRSRFMVEGSTFLWFPWTLAFCSEISVDAGKSSESQLASRGCAALRGRINDILKFARDDPFAYVMAESLFALNLQSVNSKK